MKNERKEKSGESQFSHNLWKKLVKEVNFLVNDWECTIKHVLFTEFYSRFYQKIWNTSM